jgi:hypothetical protein
MNTIFAVDMRRNNGAGKRAILRHPGSREAIRDPESQNFLQGFWIPGLARKSAVADLQF